MENSGSPSAFRYERKFVPPGLSRQDLLALVRRHPAAFQQAFPERVVNNVYFDTPGLDFYFEHLNGVSRRLKVRIRWYGACTGRIEQPVLEFKRKRGLVSCKDTCPLPALDLDGDLSAELRGLLETPGAAETAGVHLGLLQPALANRYHRCYFRSALTGIRLTVDWGLEFYSMDGNHQPLGRPVAGQSAVVIELKYGVAQAEQAVELANAFPFRAVRCSKYVLGIQRLSRL
jgi:hypothetical protein